MKQKKRMVFLLTGTMLLTGCGVGNLVYAVENEVAEKTSVDTLNGIDTSEMFTDRDKEIDYDEERSAFISLADGSSSCDADAVRIDGDSITITDEGTYILTGELTDGMVIVDAEDQDKVQLVLDGVKITSDQSAAIYVRSADKVFITAWRRISEILPPRAL